MFPNAEVQTRYILPISIIILGVIPRERFIFPWQVYEVVKVFLRTKAAPRIPLASRHILSPSVVFRLPRTDFSYYYIISSIIRTMNVMNEASVSDRAEPPCDLQRLSGIDTIWTHLPRGSRISETTWG